MRRRGGLAGVLWAAAACGGPAPAPPDGGGDDLPPPEVAAPASPASLAEIAPGDTGAILGLMRRVMTEGDGAAFTAERRDTVLPAQPAEEPRRLSLYLRDDRILKLTASEPNDAGRMTGETHAWFVDDEVRVVQEPFAAYFLDGDRIVLWTDEALEPVAAPEADRMARERAVLDTLAARLAVFGRRYP